MTISEMIANMFKARFDATEKEIPFNPEWKNGTGYFDGAVTMVELAPGEEAKCMTPSPNNRRILFIGTQLGTVVLFERYTDGADGVIVRNISSEMSHLGIIPTGQIGYDALNNILGYSAESNIGARLAKYFDVKAKAE